MSLVHSASLSWSVFTGLLGYASKRAGQTTIIEHHTEEALRLYGGFNEKRMTIPPNSKAPPCYSKDALVFPHNSSTYSVLQTAMLQILETCLGKTCTHGCTVLGIL